MNYLSRIFANAIARRVAFVLVALVFGWLGLGSAHASVHTSAADAFAHMQTDKPSIETVCHIAPYGSTAYYKIEDLGNRMRWRFACTRTDGAGNGPETGSNFHDYPIAQKCPTGQARAIETGICGDPRTRCLNKNDNKDSARLGQASQCIDGCAYGALPASSGSSLYGSQTLEWGKIGFSGDTCTVPVASTPPPKKDEECVSNPDKLTMCLKKDGKHCYSAASGRRICWGPGETGKKTDGNTVQQREPGPNKPAPPTAPPGETLNDSNKPTTTTTTNPNGTTSTTTTNNSTTGFGTNPGPNEGETPGEAPAPGEGEEEQPEDDDTIGGTGDCQGGGYQPGGNPILGYVLYEAWRARCNDDNAKDGNGTDTDTLDGLAQGTLDQIEADTDAIWDDGAGSGQGSVGEDWISFGGGSCPDFPRVTIPGTSLVFERPAAFCSIGAALRILFIALAYVIVFRWFV